jgi:ABC-type antimicrobial peptide transport system permease subunit
MRLVQAAGRSIGEIDPALRVASPQSFAARIDRSTLNERIMATLGGIFGVLALVVACIGIFGVMAFQVARRINELGVRMALGAGRGDIIALVLREGAVMLIAGAAIGIAAALAFTRFATKLLFGMTATDPKIFALSAAILGVAAFAAAWLPAQRASRVDPMTALRHE